MYFQLTNSSVYKTTRFYDKLHCRTTEILICATAQLCRVLLDNYDNYNNSRVTHLYVKNDPCFYNIPTTIAKATSVLT